MLQYMDFRFYPFFFRALFHLFDDKKAPSHKEVKHLHITYIVVLREDFGLSREAPNTFSTFVTPIPSHWFRDFHH